MIDSDSQNQLLELAQLRLSQRVASDPLTKGEISQVISQLLMAFPEWQEKTSRELAMAQLGTMFSTFIGEASVLQDVSSHKPWLNGRRESIEWRLWSRYRKYLIKKRMPQPAINSLDRITDRILELIGNPADTSRFDRRGMVVGDVQAGKTSNYTGLICKAADAGYKVIIVFAGLHNNLRSQTQVRLDEGFVGKVSMPLSIGQASKTALVGVGDIDPSPVVNWATNRTNGGDFSRRVQNQFGIHPGEAPLLFVVKKIRPVFDSLISWINATGSGHERDGRRFARTPLLVIDDEADNASIDTSELRFINGRPDPDHEPSKVNARIRRILGRFDQVSYVGYTATPFANIFIHPDAETGNDFQDLFPRDFIINMPVPSNYVGPSRIFGMTFDDEDDFEREGGLPEVFESITDHVDSVSDDDARGWMPPVHKREHLPLYMGEDRIPPSLERALDSFALVVAARRARGQERAHNSMMVHVTRFQAVQRRVLVQVQDYLDALKNDIRYGDDSVYERLRRLWQRSFIPVTSKLGSAEYPAVSWEELSSCLKATTETIRLREINGSSADALDYEEHRDTGLNVIAVGGDKLARGLTLEGLSISYFLRGSRMYDTLLQMGRWFGYKPGYLDLCKLFTTPDLVEWYEHITSASEELRREFDRMETIGATPRQFGLRVRSHSTLMVTSRVKMRHGTERRVAFAGDVSETTLFSTAGKVLEENFKVVGDFLTRLGDRFEHVATPQQARSGGRVHHWNGSHYWARVPVEYVLELLERFRTHEDAPRASSHLLARYIRRQNRFDELTHWNVLVVAGEGPEVVCIGGREIRAVVRQPKGGYVSKEGGPLRIIRSEDRFAVRRLLNPRDEAVDIGAASYELALEKTRAHPPGRRRSAGDPADPAGVYLREQRSPSTGLILLYPLARQAQIKNPEGSLIQHRFLDIPQHIMGLGISFPASEKADSVTYVVNSTYDLEGDDET